MVSQVMIDSALCDLGASVSIIPYSIFKKLGFGELQPTHISLQCADGSTKCPLGILENVPIKVDDFYVLDDFIILDIVANTYAQTILGRPFLATSDCKVGGKGGRLTFDVGECHVEFALFENKNIPSFISFRGRYGFHENCLFDDWWHVDPFVFECVTSKGFGLDYARVEFNVPAPPGIIKDEPYATNEASMSDYCRFAQVT